MMIRIREMLAMRGEKRYLDASALTRLSRVRNNRGAVRKVVIKVMPDMAVPKNNPRVKRDRNVRRGCFLKFELNKVVTKTVRENK